MKKILKISVCFLLMFSLSFNLLIAGANEAVTVASECDINDIDVPIAETATDAIIGQTLDIKAKSAILMEVSSGEILYEMNADEALPPASITKIMSLLLVMEAIERKQLSVEDVITTSEHAAGMGGSQIWLKENESMTVDDMLKAAVIASANDATVALAEKIAGSEEGFVAAMNQRAKELGMNTTHFENATGLDANGHISSAHDVAVMSRELIKYPLIKNYSTVWMESLRNGKTELVNTNKLVRFYEGTTGLKTGTTSSAGYCLSATAEREGLSLVAVIMNGESSDARFSGAKKLLDYGFSNYCAKQIEIKKEELGTVKINNGVKQEIKPQEISAVPLLLKKNETGEITKKITYKPNIEAPVKKGEKIGTLEIMQNGNTLYCTDILSGETVKKKTLLTCFLNILSGLFIL